MENLQPEKGLFLDRDGVINIDYGYVYRQSQFEFVDGIFDICRAAVQRGYSIFVVTNQAGIGRGYYSEQDFEELMSWVRAQFAAQDCPIREVYYCPTHPEFGVGAYKCASLRRKPQPGMILDAVRDFKVDLAASILVGDKESDIQAGLAAGVGRNFLYASGEGRRELQTRADAVLTDLRDLLALL
ncbi:HAD family hydrolase [Massilia sp. W12]|uniref:D-glycero-alpha-D-manno-heptose-1,7-bisphosphate 7-phosphatase n=1 Tax=Massilia sp. W12 TaxID=3126507 RepID=UPI0030CD1FBA